MKPVFAMASAFVFAASLLAVSAATTGPAAAETVIKKTPHHGVVVRHVAGHPNRVVVRHGVPANRIMMVRPPARNGQFFHRGSWFARVHGPAFHYPAGWRYRAWAIGAILPALFLTPDYFYDDYGPLGLQAPPPGYRWVRYGDDLLLVNLRTGEVEDVVNDVFD